MGRYTGLENYDALNLALREAYYRFLAGGIPCSIRRRALQDPEHG